MSLRINLKVAVVIGNMVYLSRLTIRLTYYGIIDERN